MAEEVDKKGDCVCYFVGGGGACVTVMCVCARVHAC